MKCSKNMLDMLALDARQIFVDANEYDDYELVGYCRLIRALCKRYNAKPSSNIEIANIRKILKTLDERKCHILSLRYWEGYTRIAIGDLLGLTHERIRQIENASLERMIPLIVEIKWDNDNIPIEALGLIPRGYLTLKREGIDTLNQLIKLSRTKLLEIKGVGPCVARDVKQKLDEFILEATKNNNDMFERLPIDVLKFSTRVDTALKRKEIFVIKQLREVPMEEIYRMQGIGKKGYNEVLAKKQSLEHIK